MTDSPDTLRARLAAGTAERRIIFYREAYYRHVMDGDEWGMGVDPVDEGGTHAEWKITWRDLGGEPTWRLEVFSDGIAGVAATDLLTLLAAHENSGPNELRAALIVAGWVDRTPRQDPYATFDPVSEDA